MKTEVSSTHYEWQPIETYEATAIRLRWPHVLCAHAEKRWIRFGFLYPGLNRWYYSGTNERAQYAQQEGDAPTHWMPIPKGPW